VIWKLYEDYEAELENRKVYDPMSDLFAAAGAPQTPQQGQACIIPPGTMFEEEISFVIIESLRTSSRFTAKRRFVVAASGQQFEPLIRTEGLSQGWSHRQAPEPAPAEPPKRKPRSGARGGPRP
jgi:hypothetical protein